MAVEIKVPSVGESISEVIIAQWLKPKGAWVEKDEAIVSLETDKVNVDVLAPSAGVLAEVLKDANASAAVGEVIGKIDASAAKPAGAAAAPAAKAAAPVAAAPEAPAANSATRVMPAAERALAEKGLSADQVKASGPGGRLLKEDVMRHSASPAAAAAPSAVAVGPRSEEIVPMTPLRRRLAERLLQAQSTAAILTTFNEVDMSYVMTLRKRYQDDFVKKYGTKLGFMSFFVKASIEALKAYPEINAEIRGNDIVYHNYFDIGVAVGGEKGLVVPVLRNVERMSFAEIEMAIGDFGKRANANKLKLEELQGGTFTISNGGVYGSLMSTPILNPPQSGILGMHSIVERPVGVDGRIELRPMMYIALSYDHRIVDGRGAVSFLKRIKECIESPDRMLLEV